MNLSTGRLILAAIPPPCHLTGNRCTPGNRCQGWYVALHNAVMQWLPPPYKRQPLPLMQWLVNNRDLVEMEPDQIAKRYRSVYTTPFN